MLQSLRSRTPATLASPAPSLVARAVSEHLQLPPRNLEGLLELLDLRIWGPLKITLLFSGCSSIIKRLQAIVLRTSRKGLIARIIDAPCHGFGFVGFLASAFWGL